VDLSSGSLLPIHTYCWLHLATCCQLLHLRHMWNMCSQTWQQAKESGWQFWGLGLLLWVH